MSYGWDVLREMEHLQREMDNFLSMRPSRRFGRPAFRWSFLPGRAARAYPLVNVTEDADNIYVDALAPGLEPNSLNITAVDNQLTISGEKPGLGEEVKAESYHRQERAAGRFVRMVTLPSPVDQNRAQASYTDGLLTITLPKPEEVKPKQISVKVC